MDLSEIKALLDAQSKAWTEFRERQTTLERTVEGLSSAYQRTNFLSGGFGPTGNPDTKALGSALRNYMRGNDAELKAMLIGLDPAGGYFVQPALSASMTRVEVDFSPIRQVARIVTIENSDTFEEPVDKSSAGASWVGETQARTATSTPTVAKLSIPTHEIYAMPEATQSLIDDSSVDIVGWLSDKVGQQFGISEGSAFVSGNGVGKPRGFLDYPTAATADASRSWGVLEHVVTGTSGGFGADPNGAEKLIDLVHKLKAGYRRGAVWMMNKKTAGAVRKLKDGASRFVWADSLVAGQPSSLLGYPVVEAEDMSDIAANSLSIAFGNFRRGYTVVDRIGMRFLLDPYSAKPYVRVYCYKRVGGDVNDFNAIKFLKFST